jgi:anti-anti-sigma regulatory factor
MEVTTHLDENGLPTLTVAGDLTVANAKELSQVFRQTLEDDVDIRLDLSQAKEADLTLAQLLISLDIAAKAKGRTFILAGQVPAVVQQAMHLSGVWCDGPIKDLFTRSGLDISIGTRP